MQVKMLNTASSPKKPKAVKSLRFTTKRTSKRIKELLQKQEQADADRERRRDEAEKKAHVSLFPGLWLGGLCR